MTLDQQIAYIEQRQANVRKFAAEQYKFAREAMLAPWRLVVAGAAFMTIRVVLSTALLIIGLATAQAARLEVGQTGYLLTTALACPTHDIMVNVLKIAQADFDAAAARGHGEGCVSLSKGSEVFVVEVPNAYFACIRPKGGKSCVWTAQDSVVAID